MQKAFSIEECLKSINRNLEIKYPKTKEITSDDVGVRCFEYLCQKSPKITQYNIEEITGQNEDWIKRMRKGKKTSLENGITFALFRCDTIEQVLEFLWLHGINLYENKYKIYLTGIESTLDKQFTDGRERCAYFNEYLRSKDIAGINLF